MEFLKKRKYKTENDQAAVEYKNIRSLPEMLQWYQKYITWFPENIVTMLAQLDWEDTTSKINQEKNS